MRPPPCCASRASAGWSRMICWAGGGIRRCAAPVEPWWLRVHGAAAMAFLVALGSLLPGHVSRAWQMRRNHRSGLFMLGLVLLLIATGYGLYYAGDEQTRPWISCVHWVLGLAAAGMAPLHVYLGRRRAEAARTGDRQARSGCASRVRRCRCHRAGAAPGQGRCRPACLSAGSRPDGTGEETLSPAPVALTTEQPAMDQATITVGSQVTYPAST